MAEKSRRKTVDKWRKKKWFTIKASKLFDEKILGETPAEKPIQLTNRTMKVTLDKLTGQRQKRDIIVHFKTKDVQGQSISTVVSKFEVAKSSLGRAVRRRNSKVMFVEKIPVVGGDARVSIIVITARKATAAQRTGIRELTKKQLVQFKGLEFEAVVKELLLGNFANKLYKDSGKIYMTKKVIVSKATFTEAK
jgi:small subunit ribosomal protein S3Ae